MRELILAIIGERDIIIIDENNGTEKVMSPNQFVDFVTTEVEPLKDVMTNLYCHFGNKDYSVNRILVRFEELYHCVIAVEKFKAIMAHMDLEIRENKEANSRRKRTRLIIGNEKLFFISYEDYRANVLFKKDLLDIIKGDGAPKIHKRCRLAAEIDGAWYNITYVKEIINKYFNYYFANQVLKDIFEQLGHPFVEFDFIPNVIKKENTKKIKVQEKYFDRYRRDWC